MQQYSPPEEKNTAVEETLREAPVGKGLAATLRLLEEREALRGIDDYGGRRFAKKRKNLVPDDDASEEEVRIARRDDYGRIKTPKEAFRVSHKFHVALHGMWRCSQ
ncbi:hypothetical protein Acr_28g0000380 [Actinidia rufa]|uniref:Uncharacterized protein n=1 Tax=Actinidia rufa TaxID=165716 RepID=A0A7J0H8A1_9ERIC|nr:hypothetical protein Acr_28g0000380 [Actinidia rufa]